MRIYTMTATFGKLEHETLTLEPGLNVIEAPNEWGKSTWCAFLTAMLYGLETRAKSTKTVLADKERYAPWSGSPMAGRIDLEWNGRNITIERKTKGRAPLGQFSAYETESGLPVPELTAANCGQMLLGVERSVFLRAGFIRLNDLPVTQDEALRARLNALVTTGDESGDGERLGKALRDLKNRCRYNKTGLLPQAEAERAELEEKLRELEALEYQCGKLNARRDEVTQWVGNLENHRAHLRWQAAQADETRVAQARQQRHDAVSRLEKADADCRTLPSREETERHYRQALDLRERHMALQMEQRMLPPLPQEPQIPDCYRDGDPIAVAEADVEKNNALEKKKKRTGILWAAYFALVVLAMAAVLLLPGMPVYVGAGIVILGGFAVFAAIAASRTGKIRRELDALYDRHVGVTPAKWLEEGREVARILEEHAAACKAAEAARGDYAHREAELLAEIAVFSGGGELSDCVNRWKTTLEAWEAYADAQREAVRADGYWQTLKAMAKTAEEPQAPDALSYTEPETARLLSDANGELTQLHSRLSQYQGRMEALGDREAMHRDLEKVQTRIRKLEDTYAALTIAQQTLQEASLELQRRFAPKISRRAQELMSAFTGGRYDRLSLGEDLGLRAGAGEEDTLHEALWRSDGTIDQLYLALRLAVAEALTASAPLILDDALVRFDDVRLKAALEVLKEEANTKQVILFTCQSREKALCED